MRLPRDEVRNKFRRILEESGAHVKFREILRNTKKEDVFLRAYDMALDRGYGKAVQFMEMDLKGSFIPVTNEQIYEALGERVPLELLEDESGEKGSVVEPAPVESQE